MTRLNRNTGSKYKNQKTVVDGFLFDSKAEAEYYLELKLRMRAGDISDFLRQVSFVLIDSYKRPGTGETVKAVKYIPDFVIMYPDKRIEVCDVKGVKTKDFIIKRKLFESRYNIPLHVIKYDGRNFYEE